MHIIENHYISEITFTKKKKHYKSGKFPANKTKLFQLWKKLQKEMANFGLFDL